MTKTCVASDGENHRSSGLGAPGKVDSSEQLLTKEQLRQRLNVPHVRIIEEMTRKRKLPVISMGYRTKRYSWPAVLKALEKLTVKEVGT